MAERTPALPEVVGGGSGEVGLGVGSAPPPPAARQVHAALMATEHMAHIQPASRGQGWESVPLTVPAAAVPGTP